MHSMSASLSFRYGLILHLSTDVYVCIWTLIKTQLESNKVLNPVKFGAFLGTFGHFLTSNLEPAEKGPLFTNHCLCKLDQVHLACRTQFGDL